MFDLASISTHAVCPTAVHSARHRRPDSRRLAFRSRLVGQAVAFVYNSCTLTVNPLRSGLIRPFLATMRSSDSRHGSYSQAGPLRFLDFSFPMRCLQSPRGVRRLRAGVASPAMADFNVLPINTASASASARWTQALTQIKIIKSSSRNLGPPPPTRRKKPLPMIQMIQMKMMASLTAIQGERTPGCAFC